MSPCPDSRSRRRRSAHWGLILLNVALLAALAAVAFEARALAQPAVNRPPGQYVLFSGKMQGGTSSSVYLLDVINQEMVALKWDRAGQRLTGIGYRNIAADAASAVKGR